jgi:hypothetical protein
MRDFIVAAHDQALYRERNRIERCFKLKHLLNLAIRF